MSVLTASAALASALLATVSCSKPSSAAAEPVSISAVPPPATAAGSQVASVTGTASPGAILVLESKAWAGDAPTPPGASPPLADAAQSEPPVMDQVSATFTPEMLFVRTGQPVEFRNSDDTLHNVHVGNTETREGSFNVAIPTGEVYKYTFAKDGFYHVGCDIHPAMSAEIVSVSTPFATLAAADGTFGFSNVPSGAYVLRVWASGVKTERDVDIVGGSNVITNDGRGDR